MATTSSGTSRSKTGWKQFGRMFGAIVVAGVVLYVIWVITAKPRQMLQNAVA